MELTSATNTTHIVATNYVKDESAGSECKQNSHWELKTNDVEDEILSYL